MRLTRFTGAALLVAAATLPAQAQAQDVWTWRKALPAGRTIEIKGVNGAVSATAASGDQVEVIARKTARRSDPASVELKVVEYADGITICALYPTPRNARHKNECQPGSKGIMNTNRNDTNVAFEVRVPRGVQFIGRTVNGSVRATGLSARAQGNTVNGAVRISTTGLASASTVNGAINVRMGQANWRDELKFGTVNGAVVLELPAGLSTEVEAGTVNGSISTDWPLTITGKWGPKRVHGTIGSGGRSLDVSTVNGDIELRKAK